MQETWKRFVYPLIEDKKKLFTNNRSELVTATEWSLIFSLPVMMNTSL